MKDQINSLLLLVGCFFDLNDLMDWNRLKIKMKCISLFIVEPFSRFLIGSGGRRGHANELLAHSMVRVAATRRPQQGFKRQQPADVQVGARFSLENQKKNFSLALRQRLASQKWAGLNGLKLLVRLPAQVLFGHCFGVFCLAGRKSKRRLLWSLWNYVEADEGEPMAVVVAVAVAVAAVQLEPEPEHELEPGPEL